MSTSSDASLGALRIQTRQRSGMEGNLACSDPEINQYLSQSYKELYDILVGAYGNDYHVAPFYQFQLTNAQNYPFPDGTPTYQDVNGNTAAKFYKLLRVDLQYSASPSGYVTLRRYETIEENKYGSPNSVINWNGYSTLRYRPQGNSLRFTPIPMAGQAVRMLYIPAPTSLQYLLSCGATIGSTTLTLSDTTGLSIGMNVAGGNPSNNTIVPGTTISSVASTSVVISSAPLATSASTQIYFWDDSTVLDGISGWEEYVVIDAAIKIQIKQENDFSGLAGQKMAMMQRIEAMAEGRDSGQAQHTSDVLSLNMSGWGGWDGGYGGNMGDY